MSKLKFLIVLVSAFIMSCSESEKPDVDNILKNYYEKSGAERLSKVQTFIRQSSVKTGETDLLLTETIKRPDKIRVETIIEGMNNIRIFNGIEGWSFEKSLGQEAPVQMDSNEVYQMRMNAIFDKELFIYKERGYKIESVYTDEVLDKEVYVIQLLLDTNITRKYYIDKENYEIIKVDYDDQNRSFSTETFLRDYRDVDGVRFAMEIEIKSNGETLLLEKINSIELDVEIDDSIFSKL